RTKQMNSAAYPFILNTRLFTYIRIETEINNIILPVFLLPSCHPFIYPVSHFLRSQYLIIGQI
ncbi:hypothetical protein B6U90_07675, partial [Thermoplasmatales archaeon ex4484_6]